jgi:hypothetical protein
VYDGDDRPTNRRHAVKVPADTDSIGGAQHPVWNTRRDDTYGKLSFTFQSLKQDSQHIALPEVNCLEMETIDVIPDIEEIRVPRGPKRVDGADVCMFSDLGG